MPQLTQQQLDQLEAIKNVSFNDFKTAYHLNPSTSYAAQYYSVLQTANFAYGGLAMGVILNNTIAGKIANNYAANVAGQYSVDLSVGSDNWLLAQYEIMKGDFTARHDTGGDDILWSAVDEYHAAAFGTIGGGLPPETWTVHFPLQQVNNASPGLTSFMWSEFLEDPNSSWDTAVDGLVALASATYATQAQLLAFDNPDLYGFAKWAHNSVMASVQAGGEGAGEHLVAIADIMEDLGPLTVNNADEWVGELLNRMNGHEEIMTTVSGTISNQTFFPAYQALSLDVDGEQYQFGDVFRAMEKAGEAIAGFVQAQTADAAKWFTAENGANVAFAQWLGENMQNLVNGNLDPDEAFIDLAEYLGQRYAGHVITTAITKSEAQELMKDVFVKAFGLTEAAAVDVTGTLESALARFAVDFALHSGDWNSEDYLNAGVLATTSVLSQYYAQKLFPSSVPNVNGTVAAVANVVSTLLQNDGLNTSDWIMLGVQTGVAYGSAATGAAFSAQLSSLGGVLAPGVGIIIGAVFGIVASKIIGSIYQGVRFYDGEFGSKAALLNSVYQVQKVDDGQGNMVDALVAVNSDGSTIILKAGINYAVGNIGSDILVGDGGGIAVNNVLVGGGGADYLEGRGGADDLFGDDGNDHIIGGTGDDLAVGGNGDDEIFGDEGDDILVGDAGEDFIHAGSGIDTVSGGADNDIILASAGNDVVDGSTGNDVLELGDGDDAADAGDGNDVVLANIGNDVVDGGSGDDNIFGESGNDQLLGGDGSDYLDGGEGIDILGGGAGGDYLKGGLDNDILDGSIGNDTLQGGIGDDVLLGGLDNDLLLGEIGDDDIQGGLGDDVLIGDVGDDSLEGNEGNDKYLFRSGDGIDTVSDTDGTDVIVLDQTSSSNITFSQSGNDLLISYGTNGDQVRITNQLLSTKIERLELSDGYIDLSALTFPGGIPTYTVQSNPSPTIAGINTQLSELASKESTKEQELTNNKLLGIIGQQTYHEALQNEIQNTYYNGSEIDIFKRARSIFGGHYKVYRVKKVGVFEGDSETLSYKEFKPGDSVAGYDQIVNGLKVTFNNRLFTIEDIWIDGKVASTTVIKNGQADDAEPGADFRNYNLNNGSMTTAEQRAAMGTVTTISLGEKVLETGSDKFIGSYWNETLNGQGGADYLFGGEGNDTINGDTGNDWVFGGGGSDVINADDGDDLALGGAGNDTISAGAGDDAIVGGDGSDTMSGGADNDWMDGGDGQDTVTYATSNTAVNVNLQSGTATGEGNDTLRAIEAVMGSAFDDTIIGDGGGNALSGNQGNDNLFAAGGNDTLDGGIGADTMAGGQGDDVYIVDNASDAIAENNGEGVDTVNTSVSHTLSNNVENLTLLGASSIHATGNALNNTLTGNSAVNTLAGGAGNDTYVVGASDIVIEVFGDGMDTVSSGVTWTLSNNVENLVLTGTSAINGTGNSENNTLIGNSAINTLAGGLGDDAYIVNAGDIVSEAVNAGTDTVLSDVTYTLGANIENLTLTGIAIINATGNTLDNVIVGNAANNTLNGGTGLDVLIGGSGNDAYVVDNVGDVITELTGEGIDTVTSSVTYMLVNNIENITLTGSVAISATGNALDNIITGNTGNNLLYGDAGSDTLDGGTGNDTMYGGAGDDTYFVNIATDAINENTNEGIDTVNTAVTYTLGANVENLRITAATAVNGTGNALDNILIGAGGKNILTGGDGADTLDGGAGVDTLVGGTGNDIYIVDSATDIVTELVNEGIDRVDSSATFSLAALANIENLRLTGAAAINGTGNALNNTIIGNSGGNTLDGGAGIDTLSGGAGNDAYVIDNVSDAVVENADEGVDTVSASVTYTLSDNVENLTLTGAAAINGTGNALNNILRGNSAANTLSGGAGNDTYYIDHVGDAVVENVDEGIDTISSSISYFLSATIENLTLTGTGGFSATGNNSDNILTGNVGNNALNGGNGNDTLDGGAGSDVMYGGADSDIYYVDLAGDFVGENIAEGNDTVYSMITYTLTDNVENLTLAGVANIHGTGNALDNTLIGNSGINTLAGGAGNDVYVVSTSDTIVEGAAAGIDTVQANIAWTLGANLENLTLLGVANISGTGNVLDNVITGNDGSNTLDGGVGVDTLAGGLGGDFYIVDHVGDIIVESADQGIDTVNASVSYTLASHVENLTLTGVAAINGTGNALNNILRGNSVANTLSGSAGNDTYYVDHTGDVVIENVNEGIDTVSSSITYALTANVENLSLTGTGAINGTGNALNNTLTGNGGANILTGGAGDDYYIVSISDSAVELASEGSDTIQTDITWTLATHLENLKLTGSANINGTGNAAVNIISGNTGNNTLDGGAGVDTLIGGVGNDIYIVDSSADYVVENIGEGTDIVRASATYILGAHIENLTLIGGADISGFGNGGVNTITGNTGNNTLNGGAGADTLIGGTGNDTYIVEDTGDIVTEAASAGTDTVVSTISYTLGINIENLTLSGFSSTNATGNTSNNVLTGNSNDNTLDGGTGADTLIGGAGKDVYLVDNIGDVVTEGVSEGMDTVRTSVSYALEANIEALVLMGTLAINGTGNGLDNTLTGNSGVNTLTGGAGNDVYYVSTGDVVIEASSEGADTIYTDISWTLGSNLENLVLVGSANINATGNTLVNTLTGNSGNNVLTGGINHSTVSYAVATNGVVVNLVNGTATGHGNDTLVSIEHVIGSNYADIITGDIWNNTLNGGVGADAMAGGAGNDDYYVDDINDVITENSGQGTDTVYSSVSHTLSADIENLTLTGNAGINVIGNAIANTLYGNSGNNTIDGGAGADVMWGGDGNDTYIVDNVSDMIYEAAPELQPNSGKDTIYTSVSYTAPSYVEVVILTGSASINATAGMFTRGTTLVGNSGANVLTGNGWGDTYVVSAGDTIIDNGGNGPGVEDLVISDVSWTLGVNLENLSFAGGADLNGTGNALNNKFVSNAGNNVFDGAGGSDVVSYEGAATGVVASLVTNTGSGHGNDTFMNIEGFIGSSFDDVLTGDAGNNRIYGGAGNDTLHGGDGNDTLDSGQGHDTLFGGAGNDAYNIYSINALIIEGADEGTDTVYATVSYTLAENLENLVLIGTDNLHLIGKVNLDLPAASINGTGNSLANIISGNNADNIINGGGGNDRIDGRSGNNYMYGGEGDDTLYSDAGNSFYYGGGGNDAFEKNGISSAGNDYYDGGDGFDELRYWNENGSYGLNLNLGLGSGTDTRGTHDIILNVEKILASELDDTIVGGTGNETISATYGNDTLSDGSGNDSIWGGQDNDTLSYIKAINTSYTDAFYGNNGYDTLRLHFTSSEYASGALQADLALLESFIASHQNTSDIYGDTFTFTSFGLTLSGFEALEVYVDDVLQGGQQMMRSISGSTSWMSILSSEQIDAIYSSLTMQITQEGEVQDRRSTNESKDSYFIYDEMIGSETTSEIHNFNSDEGDRLDLTYLGKNLDLDVVHLEDLVKVTQDERGTIVSIDKDGPNGELGFEETVVISHTNGSSTDHINITLNSWRDITLGTDGADTIQGSAGSDVIYAMDGNDKIYSGVGADTMAGGRGADVFLFEAESAFNNIDIIADFSTAQGDTIDVADLLAGYDPLISTITDYVVIETSGGNSTLKIDRDGAGTEYGFSQIATLRNVTGLSDETALIASGNLIIHS